MNRKLLAPFALASRAATFFLFTQSILIAAPAVQEPPTTAADSAAVDVMSPTVTISPSVRIQIRQQIPFTATLAALLAADDGITETATITPTAAITEAVAEEGQAVAATAPATDVTAIAADQVVSFLLDLSLDFVVSETMTTTVPATLTIMLADGVTETVTGALPISLAIGVSPTAQVTVTALSLLPTETVTASEGVTAVEAVTLPATITTTVPVTVPATITPTDELTATATPTPAGETSAGPESVQATTTTTANVRTGPTTNDEIADTLPAGAAVELVGVTEDGLWYLLSTGAWLFNSLANPAPTDLPLATPELIAAVEEQVAAQPAPEPTQAPADQAAPSADATAPADEVPADEAAASSVTVDANLRAGPSTEFEVIGGTVTGQAITIIGQNEAGDWYLLDNGGWVFATLVANPPADVPVVPDDATPESVGAAAPAGAGIAAILPTPTPGAVDTTQASSDNGTLSADETLYVDQVNVIAGRLQTTAATVTELIATAAADATLLEDGTWQGQLATAGQVLTRAGEEIRAITTPERFAGAQIDLESAIGSFDQVAELLTQGLANADLTTLQQAVAEFEVATVLLERGQEQLP